MDIKVLIAAHKKYDMPKDDMYLPVQAGSFFNDPIGYQRDAEGDNIGDKNKRFCELTVLYWGWKNLKSDYIGLAHYRRHFKGNSKSKDKFSQVLSKKEADALLKGADIIVPKRRNYYIETIYSHYSHTLHHEDLDVTKGIISEKYPEYLPFFEKVMNRRWAHMFNMMIMKKSILDEYCSWLFDVLFEVEEKLDVSSYSDFEARVFGRISEVLLDVFIETKGYTYKEVPFIYMEPVKWNKKIKGFLTAKFFGKKYNESF